MNEFHKIGDVYQGGYVVNDWEMRPEGQWLKQSEYPDLFRVLKAGGFSYSVDTFQLPDLRDGVDRRSNLRIKVKNSPLQEEAALKSYAAKDAILTQHLYNPVPDEKPGMNIHPLVLAFCVFVGLGLWTLVALVWYVAFGG